jgi:uncharacterized iron-regulated protein
MNKILFTLGLIISSLTQGLRAQDLPAYKIFTQEGKEIKFGKMMKQIQGVGIVLFGETHNSSMVHWLELQVTKAMYEQSSNLTLSAEMFEADDQLILNEYLAGYYDNKMFGNEAKLWKNYKTDYKPLVEFAKKHNLEFIAANIPRRYARMIYKIGITSLDSLTDEAKSYIAPMPFEIDLELPGYKNMIETMKEHNPEDSIENMARAQAAKDATMAHFILQAKTAENRVIHYVGSYHINNFDGINHYLRKSSYQNDITFLEDDNLQLADYIIAVPTDMTKTY